MPDFNVTPAEFVYQQSRHKIISDEEGTESLFTREVQR